MVEIERWDVLVSKNPDQEAANDQSVSWKIINKIRFKSDDPNHWGEFRAYGGAWTRVLNSTYDRQDMTSAVGPTRNQELRRKPRKREIWPQLVTDTSLPSWGFRQGPPKENGLEWYLDVDQHMEIFYAREVPLVLRSRPRQADDGEGNRYNDPNGARWFGDLDRLGTYWHIIARDEPLSSSFQIGDVVEYWHRGEYRIRDPKDKRVLSEQRKVALRVSGTYPKWDYMLNIDGSGRTGAIPGWERAGPEHGD